MRGARWNGLTSPGWWWALSAVALSGAVGDLLTHAPVEIAGVLVVVAALGVLAAGLCIRRRRVASWSDADTRTLPG